MAIKKETELYIPIKRFLELRGYLVRGEVAGCDVVAIDHKQSIVIVELKKTFTMELLIQGAERLKDADYVYVAIEKPKIRRNSKRWTSIQWICKQLGIGLLTVQFSRFNQTVEVVCESSESTRRKNKSRSKGLIKEVLSRSGDYNLGGSTKIPIVTAYREEALACALFLKENGPSKVSHVRQAIENPQTGKILYDNHYGWFNKTARGIYGLTDTGQEALKEYSYVMDGRLSNMEEE